MAFETVQSKSNKMEFSFSNLACLPEELFARLINARSCMLKYAEFWGEFVVRES